MEIDLIKGPSDGNAMLATLVSENMAVTPEGYLLCRNVPISRAGVFDYGRSEVPPDLLAQIGDESERIMVERPIEALSTAETSASFEGKPITFFHPSRIDPETGKVDILVKPNTWAQDSQGTVLNVRMGEGDDSEQLLADLLITVAEVIDAVRSGRIREVSAGATPVWGINPETGRLVQLYLMGNHVALVEEARCGAVCAIVDQATNQKSGNVKMRKKSMKIGEIVANIDTTSIGDGATCDEENHLESDLDEANQNLKVIKNTDQRILKNMRDNATAHHMTAPDSDIADEGEEELMEHEIDDNVRDAHIVHHLESLHEKIDYLAQAVGQLLGVEMGEDIGDDDMDMVDDDSHPARPEYEAKKHRENLAREEENEYEEKKELERELYNRRPVGDSATTKRKATTQDRHLAEVLSPGLRATKDLKLAALVSSYSTQDGYSVINKLLNGRDLSIPKFSNLVSKNSRLQNKLFYSAGELMALKRNARSVSANTPVGDSTNFNTGPTTGNNYGSRAPIGHDFNEIKNKFWSNN